MFYLLFIIPIVFYMKWKRMHKIVYVGLVGICIVQFASIFFLFKEPTPVSEIQFQATILDYKVNGNRVTGFIKAKERIYFSYTLHDETEKHKWETNYLLGNIVHVEGKWAEVSEPSHRYAFSMESYLRSKNSVGIFEIQSIQFLAQKKSLRFYLLKQRQAFSNYVDSILPPSLAQEAKALLIGLQDGLDEDVERAYQKLGITHLFAISGMHVVFLSFLFYELAILLRIRREVARWLVCILLPLYGVLAGGTPSIWRAIVVVEILQLFKLMKRPLAIDDALSLSAICFLLFSPNLLFQVGFQLSYLATYSLIYSSSILKRCQSFISLNFFMSVICQLFVLPVLAIYFYEMSVSAFIANVFFVPLYTWVIVPLNVLFVILGAVFPLFLYILIKIYEPLREQLTNVILYLKDLPYQMWVIGKPSLIIIIIAYICIVFIFIYWAKKQWLALVMSIFICIACIEIPKYMKNHVEISFINVGQGDCILIELPFKKQTILIDSGGLLRFNEEKWKKRTQAYEVGKNVVVPYLKGKGISKIDYFILTHADADHVEAAEEILEEIDVKEIHISPNSLYEEAMNDVRIVAEKKKIKIVEQVAGHTWEIQGASFHYLAPQDLFYEGNNDSLVLLFKYGQFSALFTGDLEEQGEQELVRVYGKELQNTTLLKAGHHGSKTSSSELFIETVNPEIVIFTAGKNNRFGHPNEEVVTRLENRKIPYITIGESGTIQLQIDKKGYAIYKN